MSGMKTNWDADEREKLLMKQVAKLEEEVRCNRCYRNFLKWALDVLEQAGVTMCRLPIRRVRKNNTIVYKGHSYSVPSGTYLPDFSVDVQVKEQQGSLKIFHPLEDQLMMSHPLDQDNSGHSTGLEDTFQIPLF